MTAQRLPRPEPRPGVLDIDPYVPGKSAAEGIARVFKLSSNETPLGPSPKAKAAYAAVAEHLQDYPDGAATPLREAIGRAFGLDPSHRDEAFQVVRPGVVGKPSVLVDDFRLSGDASNNARFQAAFDSIPGQVVRGGPAVVIEQRLRVNKPTLGELLPLNSVHRDRPLCPGVHSSSPAW